MFTGIVTDVGRVVDIAKRGDTRIRIATAFDTSTIELGASIACSGPCLTVVAKGDDWFAVDASAETLACTTIGGWQRDTRVNLERSLKVGDELGGHIVTGHIDGVAKVISRTAEGDSIRVVFEAPAALARFIAPKGAVAIDGVSLTVNQVDGNRFGVNLIPHTQRVTTFAALQPGQSVNLEIDVLARYVARLHQAEGG
ncbi:MAG TPA: riboflavin synthase [Candidatus Cybelea sp.]|nr:riboflavin synthase [Candidatus Cybelea sp.]